MSGYNNIILLPNCTMLYYQARRFVMIEGGMEWRIGV